MINMIPPPLISMRFLAENARLARLAGQSFSWRGARLPVMKIFDARVILCTMLALVPPHGAGAEELATVLGQGIDRAELDQARDEADRARKFLDLVWARVSRHYIEQNGLTASDAEVSEALAYHREFERKDRIQRARKLEELNQRLAAEGLADKERAHLEEFRAVLRRLAQRDAENDRNPPAGSGQEGKLLAPWIEMWKMNRALYERFGGVVALTRSGPDPRGAHLALIEDYERRGLIRYFDARLRERLHARLAARPSMAIAPGEVDFTPYWKRPIPPSYFPD